MGRTLQAPLHVEASAQTTVVSDREPELDLYRPQAVVVGGFAPLAHDISRAGRTRWAYLRSLRSVSPQSFVRYSVRLCARAIRTVSVGVLIRVVGCIWSVASFRWLLFADASFEINKDLARRAPSAEMIDSRVSLVIRSRGT